MYDEAGAAQYDPLKERLVAALSAALAQSSLAQLHTRQQLDSLLHSENPLKPDLLLSFGGAKTGVYIANENQVMRDTQTMDGWTEHKMSLAAAHNGMKTVGIPLTSMVDYDLANYKLALRKDFKLSTLVDLGTNNTGLGDLAQNMANSAYLMDEA